MDEMQIILDLSKKLGWDQMESHIAIPAIQKMITNYISNIAEATGDVLDLEDVAGILLGFSGDTLFGLLAADSPQFYGSGAEMEFINLRCEIEWLMFRGHSYTEAINEWWK